MKQLIMIFALTITLNLLFAFLPQQIFAQQENDSYQEFYDQLSPYGRWVDDPSYGSIWFPSVDPDFTPYLTNGYWAATEYGWTWVSNYEWGWAPFHYGRWDYDNVDGWFWVPDYEWSPAWVLWRRSEGYYGWTAMRPGFSINRYSNLSHENWIFIRDKDIERHDLERNFVSRKNNSLIMNNSMIVDKVYHDRNRQESYFTGPPIEEVRRTIGRDIGIVKILERDKPEHTFNKDQFQLYRPLMHRLESEPVRSSVIENFSEEKRVPEPARERQQRNMQQKEIRNVKELQHEVNNLIKGNVRDNPVHDRNVNKPNDNRRGNSPNRDQNRAGNQTNPDHQRNVSQPGIPNQPNTNTNKGQQPSIGSKNNTNNPRQPGNPNQPNNVNKKQDQQKNINPAKNDKKDQQPKPDKKDDKKEK